MHNQCEVSLSTVVLNSRDRQGIFKRLKKRVRVSSLVIIFAQKSTPTRIGTALPTLKMFLNPFKIRVRSRVTAP